MRDKLELEFEEDLRASADLGGQVEAFIHETLSEVRLSSPRLRRIDPIDPLRRTCRRVDTLHDGID